MEIAPVSANPGKPSYDTLFETFASPLMRRVRAEAYDEDIGQHSWVTAQELRADINRLALSASHHLLDLGCGPCGPLTFIVKEVGCRGTGLDVSGAAVAAGRDRAAALGVAHLLTIRQGDLNQPLDVESGCFDVAMSLDVMVHVLDRESLFREVARALVPRGRFLFADAGVQTGPVTDDEMAARSIHGFTRLVGSGFNERALETAGFRLLEVEDRTASVMANAGGRLSAREAHRAELGAVEGENAFAREQRFLETVLMLARRGAVSRLMYLAEAHGR
jgi:cyclopropane fatty-acyl-phospholipid synthase-like methyltransferase